MEYNEQAIETIDDAGCVIANKNIEIEQLRQRVAELESHVIELQMNLADTEALELGTGEVLEKTRLRVAELEQTIVRMNGFESEHCAGMAQQLAAAQPDNEGWIE